MARPECRFIKKLTIAQVQRLEQLRDDGSNKRIRRRAHAVLLSFHGSSVNELVKKYAALNHEAKGAWQEEIPARKD